jgi:SAM-dependent methyltransferase
MASVQQQPDAGIPDPPQELITPIGGTMAIGIGHLQELREMAGIAPEHHVLDIGCGPGRTAVPLTTYLTAEGGYEGFDVSEGAIRWATEEITSRYPNFRFTYADVFNGGYNPTGAIKPTDYTFPWASDRFDVVVLYSVFTHMLPDDLDHYLAEIARTMKVGGIMVASFVLLDEQRLADLAAVVEADPDTGGGTAKHLLEHDYGAYHTIYDVPEQVLGYKEDVLRSMCDEHGLEIVEPIRRGSWPEWSVPGEFGGGQDIVAARRVR